MENIKGKTQTGFEFEIKAETLDNYELLEAIAEVDDNPMVIPKLLKLLLGDQVKALKDHVRDENGVVGVKDLMAEVKDIFSTNSVKK